MADDADTAEEGSAERPLDESESPCAETRGDAGGSEAQSVSDGDSDHGAGLRSAMVVALVAVLALAALADGLGYRAHQSRQAAQQRNLFLQVGRQAAVNLTTISYTDADADVQRVLDCSTGGFYDDFQKRAPAFVEVVKQAQSKSEGTVSEAGLDSDQGDKAQVLVAVTVKTTTAGVADAQRRGWRMRIDVQKVGDAAKVFNVEFVP